MKGDIYIEKGTGNRFIVKRGLTRIDTGRGVRRPFFMDPVFQGLFVERKTIDYYPEHIKGQYKGDPDMIKLGLTEHLDVEEFEEYFIHESHPKASRQDKFQQSTFLGSNTSRDDDDDEFQTSLLNYIAIPDGS